MWQLRTGPHRGNLSRDSLLQEPFQRPLRGSKKGKCEIDPQVDCGWQVIYDRLKELGQLDKLETILPVKDWSTSRDGGPRKRVREDLKL